MRVEIGLFILFLFVLVVQVVLVCRLIKSLPKIILDWQSEAGNASNRLLNSADQLKLLDGRFFGDGEYEALKRLGFSSPLLGVAATAILIFTKSEEAGRTNSFSDLKLLFLGVAGGALLAIFNQGCLLFVNSRFQRQRSLAGLPEDLHNPFRHIDEFKRRLDDSARIAENRSYQLITMLDEIEDKHKKSLVDYISRFEAAVGDASNRSGQLVIRLEGFVQQHCESIGLRIGEMQKLHKAVNTTVDGAKAQVDGLSSAIVELTAKLSAVAVELESLTTAGISKLSLELQGAKTRTAELASSVYLLNEAALGTSEKISEAGTRLAESAQSMLQSSGSLQSATNRMDALSTVAAKKWTELPASLTQEVRDKLTPHVMGTVKHIEAQVKASMAASEDIAAASELLNASLKSLSQNLVFVRDTGSNVNKDVNSAMRELKESVHSIRSTIDSQRGMLINWKQVFDQLPVSFQQHADGVVQRLIAQLSDLLDRNHDVMSDLHQIMKQTNQE